MKNFMSVGNVTQSIKFDDKSPPLVKKENGRFLVQVKDVLTYGEELEIESDLVVLVNQYSASAAEIVSGALKDWNRARIVGQRTYGKGSVQNVIDIRKHRARLKLTTAYYYLPHGRLLHRKNGAKLWGVDPDVEVVITPRQTKRWLDIRRKTDIVHDVQLQELQGDLARQYEADIQLSTAVLLLRLMRLQHRASAA